MEYQVHIPWISSLPDSALRAHVELLSKPRDSTSDLEALPGLVISKLTHLVFSIYPNSCYNEVCYKGNTLYQYCDTEKQSCEVHAYLV